MTTAIAQIAVLLKTTVKNVSIRAVKMRLTPTCGRCGGSGNYSYCAMHGTTCFGCAGTGHVNLTPKNAAHTLANAVTAVAAGELDAYLKAIVVRKEIKGVSDRFFTAWGSFDRSQGQSLTHAAR